VVASKFIAVARSLDWHWASPTGYVSAVRTLTTPAFYVRLTATASSGGGSWAEFRAARSRQTVSVSDAAVVPGAPRTPTSCVIRVNYALTTSARGGDGTLTTMSENVLVQRVRSRWLVSGASQIGG
jgi:hypothetical protein